MKVGAVIDQLVEIFGGEADGFAVVGGHAVLAHGVHRATFDLDILVPRRLQSLLIDSLEELGFETLHQSSGYSNHLHQDPSWGRLDVVYVDENSAGRIFDGCSRREVSGRSVLVPSIAVLTAMKLHAVDNDASRKLQDLADIRALIERAPHERAAARRVFLERGRGDWLEEVGLEPISGGEPDD